MVRWVLVLSLGIVSGSGVLVLLCSPGSVTGPGWCCVCWGLPVWAVSARVGRFVPSCFAFGTVCLASVLALHLHLHLHLSYRLQRNIAVVW